MDRNTPERMTPGAAQMTTDEALAMWDHVVAATERAGALDAAHKRKQARDVFAALAQRVAEQDAEIARLQSVATDVAQTCADQKARADALEKEAGRLREFVRRCSYAHLFPVDGLKLSSEAKAALSEPSDVTPTPSEADDHGR